jgi:hypothetical protein
MGLQPEVLVERIRRAEEQRDKKLHKRAKKKEKKFARFFSIPYFCKIK